MNCQMILVISSPSSSTTGLATLILGMPPISLPMLVSPYFSGPAACQATGADVPPGGRWAASGPAQRLATALVVLELRVGRATCAEPHAAVGSTRAITMMPAP